MGHSTRFGGTRFRRTLLTEEEAAAVPARRRPGSAAERMASYLADHPDSPTAVVYYVRREDGSIKIGTSDHLASRLRRLRSDHGAITLLASEPGGYPSEDRRHKQFSDDALGGEWFRASTALLTHIESLAGAR
jgi:hypothetical protein